jgi:hypothetical protein
MPECRPQDLGEREDEMPVRDGADHLLPDELGPQGGSLGRTGGAKTSKRAWTALLRFIFEVSL